CAREFTGGYAMDYW
nr:immunoglobulin heavy chain junction region [Mus musculus]